MSVFLEINNVDEGSSISFDFVDVGTATERMLRFWRIASIRAPTALISIHPFLMSRRKTVDHILCTTRFILNQLIFFALHDLHLFVT